MSTDCVHDRPQTVPSPSLSRLGFGPTRLTVRRLAIAIPLFSLASQRNHLTPSAKGHLLDGTIFFRAWAGRNMQTAAQLQRRIALERLYALPLWKGAIAVEPLKGGLSNMSFKVVDAGATFVVRVGDDFPVHHVSRHREFLISQWAHSAGLSPNVVWAGEGILVCEFIEGRTYGPEDVRTDLERIVPLIRRCHTLMPTYATGAVMIFWVFHVLRDYARTLEAAGHPIVSELPRLTSIASNLEAAQIPLPIIFGHHDLLPANFIADSARLWLIDWEYGGFGTAMFDLANISANASLSQIDEERLLELYFERPVADDFRNSFAAMKVASALREALWAMVSESSLRSADVDYQAYACECLAKFESVAGEYQRVYGHQ
jgi:thiamine kinase-like enzyme